MVYFTTSNLASGPIIPVLIGVNALLRAALASSAIPFVRGLRQADLLIDTGATITSIDDSIIAALNLSPTGSAKMQTPSTGGNAIPVPTFEIELTIPGNNPTRFSTLTVIGGTFLPLGYHGLLGRDVLAHGRMEYDGPKDLLTLAL
jgi:hypothetical protein